MNESEQIGFLFILLILAGAIPARIAYLKGSKHVTWWWLGGIAVVSALAWLNRAV